MLMSWGNIAATVKNDDFIDGRLVEQLVGRSQLGNAQCIVVEVKLRSASDAGTGHQ